jgi:hypothetical protein
VVVVLLDRVWSSRPRIRAKVRLALELHRDYERIRAVGGSYRLIAIVDDLLVVPAVHIPYLASRFNVTYPTAKADVDRLLKAGILKGLPGLRRRAFYAPEVVSIIYSDVK